MFEYSIVCSDKESANTWKILALDRHICTPYDLNERTFSLSRGKNCGTQWEVLCLPEKSSRFFVY